ncbi:MAG TPA: aminopeptidase P family protein [Pyrinomonadaceae bacterium]|nr:aminopeptidase P family protein [Pyrinomonadaceae bacterium]
MKKLRATRVAFVLLAVCIALVLFAPGGAFVTTNVTATNERRTAPNIKLAPPAPVFNDKERVAELMQRRERVAQSVGPQSFLVLFSSEPRVYAYDVDYPYRQENNLYYLTNLKQNGATLVLLPGNTKFKEVLFMPRRNPAMETWTGHMYSAQEAHQLSGIREIWQASEFEPFIKALRNRQPYRPKAENIFMSDLPLDLPLSNDHGFGTLFEAAGKNEAGLFMLMPGDAESREYRPEQRFAVDWSKTASGYSIKNAWPIFVGMRLVKSPMEIRILQHAIDISIEAHQRSWVAAATAKWEYEVDAEVAYTFKLRNADNWGYPDIVGCGPNATTLHYIESQGPVKPGDLLLMDVGAEYDHYTADITRTFPVNGKFTPAQAEVYQVVYDAQEAVAKASRPGATLSDVNRAGTEVIKDGLLKLGLITDRNSNQHRIWFMHGTSHWLGMNVHDVGGGAKFVPGVVFTNEPGIYVRPEALDQMPYGWSAVDWEKFKIAIRPAFEKYKGMGVRIEDDMLITENGVRWLSEALPRKIADIEDFIAKARRQSE